MMGLNGDVVIVFGATGRVGGGVCRVLAEQGARVAVHCMHSRMKAEQIVKEIKAAGGEAMVVQGDVSNESEAAACVQEVIQAFGKVDGVFDLIHRDKEFEPAAVTDMTWNDWEVHIQAMKAYFHICKAVIPVMRKQKYGRIVFLSGGLTFRFLPGCAPFSAVKAGMNAFSKTLALEEGKNGITVNVIAPGKISAGDQNAGDEWLALERKQMENNPVGRFATPEDIGQAAVNFLRRESSYITGQTLFLAGGEIMPMP